MAMNFWTPGRRVAGIQAIIVNGLLLVLVASAYFAAWQLGIAATLIALGVYVWWRSRRPRLS